MTNHSLREAAVSALVQAGYSRTDYDPTRWTKPGRAVSLIESADLPTAILYDVLNGSERLRETWRFTNDNISAFAASL